MMDVSLLTDGDSTAGQAAQMAELQHLLQLRERTIREREDVTKQREAEISRLQTMLDARQLEIEAIRTLLLERESSLRRFEAATDDAPDVPLERDGSIHSLESVLTTLKHVEGWCTEHKATKLYELASSPDCALAVEIGIFEGKSLLPVASAFARKGTGVIYGVEPWDNAVAVETATNNENDAWWNTEDLTAHKRKYLGHLRRMRLENHARLLEIPSDAAVAVFQSPRYAGQIDLVHVDGAHSVQQSVFDSAYWLKLLRRGGYLVLDDINWEPVRLAYEYMKQTATLLYAISNDDEGHFAIFRKP